MSSSIKKIKSSKNKDITNTTKDPLKIVGDFSKHIGTYNGELTKGKNVLILNMRARGKNAVPNGFGKMEYFSEGQQGDVY
jgi:hypothetical protein